MPNLEKVIKGLECCGEPASCRNCPYPCYCEYADDWPKQLLTDALALIKEQKRIIKLYEKAEPFLHSHGWDWTLVEGWVKQEEALKSEEKTNA